MAWGLPTWLGGGGGGGAAGTTSQPEAVGHKSKDGGRIAPDRNAREICYESRDIFFECLDKNDILDAIKEDDKVRRVCPQEVTAYEKDCARSWIKYFKEKRVMEFNRDRTLQRIQEDDAKMAAKSKTDGKKGSWLG